MKLEIGRDYKLGRLNPTRIGISWHKVFVQPTKQPNSQTAKQEGNTLSSYSVLLCFFLTDTFKPFLSFPPEFSFTLPSLKQTTTASTQFQKAIPSRK